MGIHGSWGLQGVKNKLLTLEEEMAYLLETSYSWRRGRNVSEYHIPETHFSEYQRTLISSPFPLKGDTHHQCFVHIILEHSWDSVERVPWVAAQKEDPKSRKNTQNLENVKPWLTSVLVKAHPHEISLKTWKKGLEYVYLPQY